MTYPWWVTEKEQCIWCRTYSNLVSVGVNKEENAVEMYYSCENPNCEHLQWFKVPNKVCILQHGKGAVDVFNRKMKEPTVEYAKVEPEDVNI